jgi:hypothetical protein
MVRWRLTDRLSIAVVLLSLLFSTQSARAWEQNFFACIGEFAKYACPYAGYELLDCDFSKAHQNREAAAAEYLCKRRGAQSWRYRHMDETAGNKCGYSRFEVTCEFPDPTPAPQPAQPSRAENSGLTLWIDNSCNRGVTLFLSDGDSIFYEGDLPAGFNSMIILLGTGGRVVTLLAPPGVPNGGLLKVPTQSGSKPLYLFARSDDGQLVWQGNGGRWDRIIAVHGKPETFEIPQLIYSLGRLTFRLLCQ